MKYPEYRKPAHTELNEKSKTFTASIDAFRQYSYQDARYHLSAIEIHHKDEAEAIKLRDLIFDFLTNHKE